MKITLYEIIMVAIYLTPTLIAAWQAIKARNYKRVSEVVIQTIEGAPPTISDVLKRDVAAASRALGNEQLVDEVVQAAVKKITQEVKNQ